MRRSPRIGLHQSINVQIAAAISFALVDVPMHHFRSEWLNMMPQCTKCIESIHGSRMKNASMNTSFAHHWISQLSHARSNHSTVHSGNPQIV